MVKRVLGIVPSLAIIVLIAVLIAGCGSGSREETSASPSVSASPSKGEREIAEAKVYFADMKPAMKGEAAAYSAFIDAQNDFAKASASGWDYAAVERMHKARKAIVAAGRRVHKIEPPTSMRKPHRALERYFSQLDRSIRLLLEMIDAGTYDQAKFDEAQDLNMAAQQSYYDWVTEAENRCVVALGRRLPFKTHD